MPKILWLTDNYYPSKGGMAESCDRITYNLRQTGLYIEIVHFHRKRRPLKEAVLLHGKYSPCLVYPDPEHALSLFWHQHESRLQKAGFTHVVVFGGSYAMTAGPIFAAWLQASLVTCLRGNDFDLSIFSAKRQPLLLNTLERSEHICSVTEEKAKKVSALFPRKRVHWTPNSIDTTHWKPTPSEQKQANALREETKGRVRLGLFGHLKQKKGLDFLLKIIAKNRLQEQIHLLLVGELDEEHLRELEELNISFSLYPFMERYDLLPLYLSCDYIGIPSFYEGMPNVLLEGGSLGVPFWCSTAGGMGDILTEGKEAFLFSSGDERGAGRALRKSLSTPEETRVSMGKELLALISTTCTIENETKNYLSIFNEKRTT